MSLAPRVPTRKCKSCGKVAVRVTHSAVLPKTGIRRRKGFCVHCGAEYLDFQHDALALRKGFDRRTVKCGDAPFVSAGDPMLVSASEPTGRAD